MKLFILLLILAMFIQTSFLSVNLCLILLIARSLIVQERSNLFAAFFGGILLGVLSSVNLGFWPFVFLIVVAVCQFVKKSPPLANIFATVTTAVLLILLVSIVESVVYHQNINPKIVAVEMVLLIPAFLLINFWEERFVVRPDIKLRLKS